MNILIAGLPKTGTTGLFYLIVNSTNKNSKILFEPSTFNADDFMSFDNVIAKILINKDIDLFKFSGFEKKIILVRDPRDRIISSILYSQFHANYLHDDSLVSKFRCLLEQKEKFPESISIMEICSFIATISNKPFYSIRYKDRLIESLNYYDSYLSSVDNYLFYKYEDFVSGVYSPIEEYLNVKIAGDARVPDELNRVVRTKKFGDWRNWFTHDDVKAFKPILDPWLQKYGYDKDDWSLNEPQIIPVESSSEYFMRLVEEYRGSVCQQ